MIVNKRITKSYPGTGDIFTSVFGNSDKNLIALNSLTPIYDVVIILIFNDVYKI